jgi:hypothetical protein
MAARVAEELSHDADLEVTAVKGGLGEFRVSIDGETRIETNRLWYPTPSKVVAKVRTLVADATS